MQILRLLQCFTLMVILKFVILTFAALTSAIKIKPKDAAERTTLVQFILRIYNESLSLHSLGYSIPLDAPCYRDLLLFMGKIARHKYLETNHIPKKPTKKPLSFYGLPKKKANLKLDDIVPDYLTDLIKIYYDAIKIFGYQACVHSGIVTATVASCLMCDKWGIAALITQNVVNNLESDSSTKAATVDILINKLLKVTLKKMQQYEISNEIFALDYEALATIEPDSHSVLHESEVYLFENHLTRESPIIKSQQIDQVRVAMIHKIEKRLMRNSVRALSYALDLINIGRRRDSNFLNASLLKLTRSMYQDFLEFLQDGIATIKFGANYKKAVQPRYRMVRAYIQEIITLHNQVVEKIENSKNATNSLSPEIITADVDDITEEELEYAFEEYYDEDDFDADEVRDWLHVDNEDCVVERDFWE
jgi:hypothetical protein